MGLLAAPSAWFILFAAGAAVILLAGAKLPVLGRSIASRGGVGDTAVGLFMLAIVTSLPELAVTLAAMKFKAADLAFGNVLGSNNFNLLTAGVLALMFGGRLFSGSDARRYLQTGLLLVVSTALAGAGVVLAPRWPGLLPVFLFSVPIAVLFVAESRLGAPPTPESEREPRVVRTAPGSRSDVVAFVTLALVVVAAGMLVSWAAKRISLHEFTIGGGSFVFGETFIGTLLVAVATSLPEVTVALAAMRRADSPDMALGTLLGSNSFNLLVFAVGAPLMSIGSAGAVSAWSRLSGVNLINVGVALVLTSMVLAALRRARSRRAGQLLAALTIPVYLGGVCAIYAA